MRGLSESEMQVIGDCLRAAADGPFFPDWEFSTIFGLERAEVKSIAAEWPRVAEDDEDVIRAVQNSLNNLLGYPHGMKAALREWVPGAPSAIRQVFEKWLGAA